MVLDKEQQIKLIQNNQNLIYSYLCEYLRGDLNTWQNVLIEGLCKAAKSYDPDYGTAFSSYAYTCMTREVQEHNLQMLLKVLEY